jgi:signal transduction histidine kinase
MMDELARWLVDPSGLTPHVFCLAWEPGLIWLHAVSDASIGIAYFTIPLALAILVHRRRDLLFKPVFLLFAAFIVLCGTCHLLNVLTLWVPAYGLEGLVKAVTASVSVVTAVMLWVLMPRLMLLPSPLQLREANDALSQRARQAQELSRLNDDLEQFAYIASHDLKAPLRAIGQLANWIGQDIQGIASPEVLENLQLMRQRADRVEMLIMSLLNYARVGHDKAEAEIVHLGDMVADIVSSIAPPPGFQVRFQGEMPLMAIQRAPLDHVLRNLISNAIKHHDRSEGHITVSMRMVDGVAEFRVEDDGPGIAPAFHKQIFMIFQTLQSRDDRESSGVGLSIVQKIVQRGGGTVWIESAPPRRGTVFLFTWPEAVIPTVTSEAAQRAPANH